MSSMCAHMYYHVASIWPLSKSLPEQSLWPRQTDACRHCLHALQAVKLENEDEAELRQAGGRVAPQSTRAPCRLYWRCW